MSITGGGSGSIPMMFAVDVHENRQQRLQMGNFIRLCRLVEPDDWVLSTHAAGGFYRSLDLMTEILENAGATVLSGGNAMTQQEIVDTLINYQVNVLTGDGSQITQVVYNISILPPEERARIKLNKIIYTSEPLTKPQRALVRSTLGDGIKICSVLGSAEAGAWAISNPDLTGDEAFTNTDSSSSSTDFVFDTRSMLIEIFPSSLLDDSSTSKTPASIPLPPLPLGEPGLIVQTSLQRLRNPLVRYITGDIGSLHPLPDSPTSHLIPPEDRKYLRVLRMQGRDRRFSFKWFAVYIEFDNLRSLMQREELGILQWQVILGQLDTSPQTTLEVRLLRTPSENPGIVDDEKVVKQLWVFFYVLPENQHLFRIVFLKDLAGFETSSTAGKVIQFVDRVHSDQ